MASAISSLNNLIVEQVRVVAHTMGPVVQGGQLSQNHWSIYLLTAGGGSVRVNMAQMRPTDDNGTMSVTRHTYTESNSAVKFFDFPATNGVNVGRVLRLFQQKGRQRYRMTGTGVGCRHWMYGSTR